MVAPSCSRSALVACRIWGRHLSNFTPFSQLSSGCQHHQTKDVVSLFSRTISTALNSTFLHHGQACVTPSRPVLVTPHRHLKWYTDTRISGNLGAVGIPEADPDVSLITDKTVGQEIAQMVNGSLEQRDHGRLFAVVMVNKRQRKVTTEDVIVIESEFPPTVGDKIRLEKVLVVGGKDFTLLGQPMLSRDQAYVEATVIEKTLSHNQIWATYKRRKRFRKLKLFRTHQTMIVINRIELNTIQEHGESS